MPVPTDTLWNIQKLNRWFAVSAILLMITFVWSIMQDYDKGWRRLQKDGKDWEAAIVTARMQERMDETNKNRLEAIESRIAALEKKYGKAGTADTKELPGDDPQHEADKQRMRNLFSQIDDLSLRLNNEKALVARDEVLLQDARTSGDEGAVKRLEAQLAESSRKVTQWTEQVAQWRNEEFALRQAVQNRTRELIQLYKDRKAQQDEIVALEKKREEVAPESLVGKIGTAMRRIPLLQFMNPAERVRQIVMPDIQMDLSFVTTEVMNC